MSEDSSANYIRRERLTDALLEFERRIHERLLATDDSECWDLLLNRPPANSGDSPHPAADPLPLRYETREGVSLLRIEQPDARNLACLNCDLFGRAHCGGGLAFLYYALRDAGCPEPLDRLAVPLEPGLYLPDWELMWENRRYILLKLRDFYEANLARVDGRPGDSAR